MGEITLKLRISAYALLAFALMTSNAYAYIDPGTGSVVTTAIIGFFAAIVYTARRYFYRLKDMFGIGSRSRHDNKTKK